MSQSLYDATYFIPATILGVIYYSYQHQFRDEQIEA